jgi:hypothetical protein
MVSIRRPAVILSTLESDHYVMITMTTMAAPTQSAIRQRLAPEDQLIAEENNVIEDVNSAEGANNF